MEFQDLLPYIGWGIAAVAAISIGGILAAVHNTRLKIKHGYPLEGMWGQSLKPAVTTEASASPTVSPLHKLLHPRHKHHHKRKRHPILQLGRR